MDQSNLVEPPENNRYRKLKTGFMVCLFIAFGVASSVEGPTIPDMVERLCVTIEVYSRSMAVGAIGKLTGSFMFGYLSDRFTSKFELLLVGNLLLVGTMLILKPYTYFMPLFYTWAYFEDLGFSAIDATCNGMVFKLWGEKGNSAMHALHLGWGIGFFISPFIVMPFLGSTKSPTNITANMTTASPICNDDSSIHMPYIIAGVLVYALAAVALALYFYEPPKTMLYHFKPRKSFREVISPSNCGAGDPGFAVLFLILFALFYFGNAGREWTLNIFLFTYAVKSNLGFTKVEAALFDASAKGSFILGRLLIVPISHIAPIQPMLFSEVYSVMALIVCMVTLGTRDKTMMWVFTCLQNMVASTIWPGGITWADKYIPVTGIIYTVLILGSSTSGFFFQWLTGYLFTYQAPDDVLWLLVGCSGFICVLLIVMQIIASRHGNRYHADQQDNKAELKTNTLVLTSYSQTKDEVNTSNTNKKQDGHVNPVCVDRDED